MVHNNASGDLQRRYKSRLRQRIQSSADEVCAGDSKDIAYENLLRLLEEKDVSAMIFEINVGRAPDDRLNMSHLQQRTVIALEYFARQAFRAGNTGHMTTNRLEYMLNQTRQGHGLPALGHGWSQAASADALAERRQNLANNDRILAEIAREQVPWRRIRFAPRPVPVAARSAPPARNTRIPPPAPAPEPSVPRDAEQEERDAPAEEERTYKRPSARASRPQPYRIPRSYPE
jgi:hypothetical protein